ncbi:hypothetical protein [Prevotella koreensis]
MNVKDIISEFRKYSEDHPLRNIVDQHFDKQGNPILEGLGWVNAFNTINAIGRALLNLSYYDKKAYQDMIKKKLKAKQKDTYNLHGLISALAELSIMNTFICRSSKPESFIYEDRLQKNSNKNVEFSIEMRPFRFHVEVKTSDLLLEDKKIANALQKSPEVLVLDARVKDFDLIQQESPIPVIGSLEQRIKDFLESANGKFRKSDDNEVNLLVICWDERIEVPLIALKASQAEGLMTNSSFLKDTDGNPVLFNNIDCILVNSNYLFFKEYVMGILFNRFSLVFPVDPFFQLFTQNYLIENTVSQERNRLLESIIQQKVYIVDEAYADSLPKKSIAKFTGHRMIKFMPFTDK